jgi:hypothetical protein
MLYWLVTAMYPQFLITLDEELQDKQVTVRVGQAVNTVGLAGQRLGISGVSAPTCYAFVAYVLTTLIFLPVPNTSNPSPYWYWRASRIWYQRVLPIRKRVGESCHHQEE